ncbi:MAG TPA: TIR domain-containing protein [Ktedonobacteraceae bacterium]
MARPIDIVFCYARSDEADLQKLKRQLKPLERVGLLRLWYDRMILPGEDYARVIERRLDMTQLILLLVSGDFLASDYCYDIELRRALERRQRGEVEIIPIILRPCLWQDTPLGPLQALPTNGQPIIDASHGPHEDYAWMSVAEGVKAVAQGLQDRQSAPETPLALVASAPAVVADPAADNKEPGQPAPAIAPDKAQGEAGAVIARAEPAHSASQQGSGTPASPPAAGPTSQYQPQASAASVEPSQGSSQWQSEFQPVVSEPVPPMSTIQAFFSGVSGNRSNGWFVPVLKERLHYSAVTGLALAVGGNVVFCSSLDGTFSVWETLGGPLRGSFYYHAQPVEPIHALALSGDEQTLALGKANGETMIYFWRDQAGGSKDVANFALAFSNSRRRYSLKRDASKVLALALSNDGSALFSGNESHEIVIWEPAIHGKPEPFASFKGDLLRLTMPSNERLVGASAREIWQWDLRDKKAFKLTAGQHRITAFALSAGSGTLVWSEPYGPLQVRNLTVPQRKHTIIARVQEITNLALSADGSMLFCAGNEGTIEVWNLARFQFIQTLREHDRRVTALALSGNTLVSGYEDGMVIVWRQED